MPILRQRKGLLDRQRPKRRRSLKRYGRHLAVVGIMVFMGIGLYYWLQRSYPKLASLLHSRPRLVLNSKLSDEDKKKLEYHFTTLSVDSRSDLEAFSSSMHRELGLRTINLIRVTPEYFSIELEPFSAEMLIELDTKRFVTKDSIIFGEVKDIAAITLPTLKGQFDSKHLEQASDGTFLLRAGDKKIVSDALLAIEEGKKYNIKYRNISYDPFRGLIGDLDSKNYRVVLGFAPFHRKYLKRGKIIDSLKDRDITAATIELDYKGKAFVKESVL